MATVPFVRYEGKSVYDSLNICEFFEDQFQGKGTPLLPGDAADRAMIRFIASRFDIGPFYGLLKAQDDETKETMKSKVDGLLEKFNNELHQFIPNPSGPYLCGEFSLADIAVFPFLDRFPVILKHYRNYDINLQKYDRIHTAFEAVKQREAFQKASCPPEFYIQVNEHHANPHKE